MVLSQRSFTFSTPIPLWYPPSVRPTKWSAVDSPRSVFAGSCSNPWLVFESFGPSRDASAVWGRVLPVLLLLVAALSASGASLPKRLVIALDGIAYRDLKSLQEGVERLDADGKPVRIRAFTDGYFPISRLVSTFPSASDVAWTEILGNRPLPGYQRTYYSRAANRQVSLNGLASSMEYEQQVTWRVQERFHFAMSYVRPLREFRYEVDRMVEDFLNTQSASENYYALVLSSDSAQHMAADILAMLCSLDLRLQGLRAAYRAREGRELEILILSDHGNNHAGRGRRVEVRKFLRDAGYRLGKTLEQPGDVVLPTVGIESWVEIHNHPAETERLVQLLSRLEGVDLVTGRLPGPGDRFLVMNSRGHRAIIHSTTGGDAYRYWPTAGDPLEYLPVIDALRRKGELDAAGFATADAWMAETLSHRYPVALERIARGHTRAALNPATILISLANDYMHADWLVTAGSKLMKSGGTHGSLGDLCSTGILLSNFAPTRDTTASRVAAIYDGFPGLRDPREGAEGAEWISGPGQELAALERGPLDWNRHRLARGEVLLRAWSPRFVPGNRNSRLEIAVKPARPPGPRIHRWDPDPSQAPEQRCRLAPLAEMLDSAASERLYELPAGLVLDPGKEYCVTGWIPDGDKPARLFRFNFLTDQRGRPAPF